MPGAVHEIELVVTGYTELMKTLKNAPKDVRLAVRKEYRTIARPTKDAAEGLALSEIRNIGPAWSQFRIGITQKFVYVAPKERGIKRGDHPHKRANLGELIAGRVSKPALEQNKHQIKRDFDQMLDRLSRKWDHDGP